MYVAITDNNIDNNIDDICTHSADIQTTQMQIVIIILYAILHAGSVV